MLEASEGLQNFVTENASALKNKLSKYGQEFLNWGRENLTFDMGGVDPESQRLAQIERARQDLLARPDYRQRLAQVDYDRASKELEENPLPYPQTVFEKAAASAGGSSPSYGVAALSVLGANPATKIPSILLSNYVASTMVANEAVQMLEQDEVFLEITQNMTDAQKQEILNIARPIANFEAKNTRFVSEASAADAASMLPIGGIPTRLGLDLAGGGVSELFDFDISGRAVRRGLRHAVNKLGLTQFQNDPRLQMVESGQYAKAYPDQARDAFNTGMLMSSALATPTTIAEGLFNNYKRKQLAGNQSENPNANPDQIEALKNTILQKLETLNAKDPKQVKDIIDYNRVNPIGVNVVEELRQKVQKGGTLNDNEKKILTLYNKLPAFLDAPVEEGPTTASEDILASGTANMTEYYEQYLDDLTSNETQTALRQDGVARATQDGPDTGSQLLRPPPTTAPLPQPQSDLELRTAPPISPDFAPLDDSAIIRESKRRKLRPGQALKKAQKKGFQTDKDRNLSLIHI